MGFWGLGRCMNRIGKFGFMFGAQFGTDKLGDLDVVS